MIHGFEISYKFENGGQARITASGADTVSALETIQALLDMKKEELRLRALREAEEASRDYKPGTMEAVARALRSAMGDTVSGWQDYCTAAVKSLVHMPASAIEARRAGTLAAPSSDESAVPSGETPQLSGPSGASHD